MRNWNDLLGCLLFIAIGIGVIIRAVDLGLGSATEPKPGFFPFLGGVALIIFSGILLFESLIKRGRAGQSYGNLVPPILLIIGLIFYVLTVQFLGYIISTSILSVVTLSVLRIRKWWGLSIVGPLIAVGSYILFSQVLDVPLPKGIMAGLF
jgi:hypothetical protein